MNYPTKYQVRFGIDGGAFEVPFKRNGKLISILHIVASDGMNWEHVSVSLKKRCPTWEEMCFIKGLFFEPEDCVVQYHPPAAKYISRYDTCLHLWRPLKDEIPMPPMVMV